MCEKSWEREEKQMLVCLLWIKPVEALDCRTEVGNCQRASLAFDQMDTNRKAL